MRTSAISYAAFYNIVLTRKIDRPIIRWKVFYDRWEPVKFLFALFCFSFRTTWDRCLKSRQLFKVKGV